MNDLIIRAIVFAAWTILTYFVCRMDDSKEAVIGVWKAFMLITSIAMWIIFILMLVGVIK